MSRFKLSWEVKELFLKNVFTIARGSRSSVHNIFIHLQKDGVEGIGESSPNKRYGESTELALQELQAFNIDCLNDATTPDDVEAILHKEAADISPSTRVAIEMAWLDWWAKSQNQPLWQLLNYAEPVGPVSSYTIGIDTIEVMQQKIVEASDYPIYKIKLGTDHDRALIQGIREVTDKPIRVDANEGWKTVDQALQEIEFLASQNVELVEQPMHSSMVDELKALKKQASLPLCADESFTGTENLHEIAECFDIINIKLMKMGSVVKARRVVKQAHDLGLEVMIGCMIESSLANAAGGLVALNCEYADVDGHLLISNDPWTGFGLNAQGQISLSNSPGLGVG